MAGKKLRLVWLDVAELKDNCTPQKLSACLETRRIASNLKEKTGIKDHRSMKKFCSLE